MEIWPKNIDNSNVFFLFLFFKKRVDNGSQQLEEEVEEASVAAAVDRQLDDGVGPAARVQDVFQPVHVQRGATGPVQGPPAGRNPRRTGRVSHSVTQKRLPVPRGFSGHLPDLRLHQRPPGEARLSFPEVFLVQQEECDIQRRRRSGAGVGRRGLSGQSNPRAARGQVLLLVAGPRRRLLG